MVILENNALSKDVKFARKIVLTLIKMHEFLTMYCYCNCEQSELSGLFNGTDFIYISGRPYVVL